jgi:hypothetical protein
VLFFIYISLYVWFFFVAAFSERFLFFRKTRMPDRITGLCGMMGFYLEPAEENT